MSCYMAPESPRPSSVTSEFYFRQSEFINGLSRINNDTRRCLFDDEYEKELCFCLGKHAEVNSDDRLCLVGDEAKWTDIIQERLFLNKNVYFIDCSLQKDAIKEQLSTNKFDRIILLNCLHKINTSSLSFLNLLHKSLTINGRILIIYREPNLNTLPLPSEVLTKWFTVNAKSERFIAQIYCEKRSNVEICRSEETIKFTMHKLMWFSLLHNQLFYPLPLIDQKQIVDGIRQLNETYFKYHPGLVEIHDRLSFLTIQNETDPFIRFPNPIQSFKTQRKFK